MLSVRRSLQEFKRRAVSQGTVGGLVGLADLSGVSQGSPILQRCATLSSGRRGWMVPRLFSTRRAAGQELGAEVALLGLKDPLVLALPRGGVPVGCEVARRLGAPLDVLVVRKVGAPGQPELAIGAVGRGVTVSDPVALAFLEVSQQAFNAAAERERREVERRERAFREGRPALNLQDRTAILVDDGLATGATMLAAVSVARRLGARQVIVAVPVASRQAIERLQTEANRVISLLVPEPFAAVGYWYEHFTQTDDEEVRRLLHPAESRLAPAASG
jgi:putative phosphoribosyl transferase